MCFCQQHMLTQLVSSFLGMKLIRRFSFYTRLHLTFLIRISARGSIQKKRHKDQSCMLEIKMKENDVTTAQAQFRNYVFAAFSCIIYQDLFLLIFFCHRNVASLQFGLPEAKLFLVKHLNRKTLNNAMEFIMSPFLVF